MAEKVKKAKAPATPRAAASETKAAASEIKKMATTTKAKKKTVAEQVKAMTPSREEIARLAQQYWEERGWQDGQAEQDWLRAEQELMKMAS